MCPPRQLTHSPRKSMKKMLFVTITLSWTKLIECKKCFENRAHPDYKKHIWSRNVKQHYSKCKFGCNSPEGVTLFVKIVMWMLRPLFHLQMNHYIWCVFIMFVTMVMNENEHYYNDSQVNVREIHVLYYFFQVFHEKFL